MKVTPMSSKAETIDYLRKVRALIERGWTQRASARNALGEPCSPRDKRAMAWCILGACEVVESDNFRPSSVTWKDVRETFLDECGECGESCTVGWNDAYGRTREEVLAVLDRTIARVESDGEPCQK